MIPSPAGPPARTSPPLASHRAGRVVRNGSVSQSTGDGFRPRATWPSGGQWDGTGRRAGGGSHPLNSARLRRLSGSSGRATCSPSATVSAAEVQGGADPRQARRGLLLNGGDEIAIMSNFPQREGCLALPEVVRTRAYRHVTSARRGTVPIRSDVALGSYSRPGPPTPHSAGPCSAAGLSAASRRTRCSPWGLQPTSPWTTMIAKGVFGRSGDSVDPCGGGRPVGQGRHSLRG